MARPGTTPVGRDSRASGERNVADLTELNAAIAREQAETFEALSATYAERGGLPDELLFGHNTIRALIRSHVPPVERLRGHHWPAIPRRRLRALREDPVPAQGCRPTRGDEMNEMVERVAKLLANKQAYQLRPEERDGATPEAWAEAWWSEFEGDARDTIAAMREPTRAMIDAADDAGGTGDDGRYEQARPEFEWRAMIDAALGPDPTTPTNQ